MRHEFTTWLKQLRRLFSPRFFVLTLFAGTFRFAASDFAALTLVPPLLASLRRAAPQVRVQVLPVDGDTTRRLELGELDFSFWGTVPPEAPFRFASLFRESFVAIADHAHPVFQPGCTKPTLDDVLRFPHAVISLGDAGRNPVDAALRQLGRFRQIGLITPGFASTIAALPGSDPIACLPSRLRVCLPATLRCFDLPLSVPSFDCGLLWHDNASRQLRQNRLRSSVQDVLGDALESMIPP